MATHVEGDIDVYAFATHEERMHGLDSIAHFYWQGKSYLPGVAYVGLSERCFYGPFS